MMQTLLKRLILHEGIRLKPYKDTVGKLTIGVGRNLDDVGISREEAEILLANDVAVAMREADKNMPWLANVDEFRRGIIYEMCFNLGINRLMLFKSTLTAVREGRYKDAAKNMLDSKWASQVGKRAVTLASLMANGA